jgi:formylglycine-generating enzyme required for sulfatase activity
MVLLLSAATGQEQPAGSDDMQLTDDMKTIAPTVLYPSASGIRWSKGAPYLILWDGFPGSTVRIELYKGSTLNRTIKKATPNDGELIWTVPAAQTLGTDFRIKITSVAKPGKNDSSDRTFKINALPVVTYPNLPDILWPRGASCSIRWANFPDPKVRIDLYKGGTIYRTIKSSTDNDGEFAWMVPTNQATGTDYRIKISSTTNTNKYDLSDEDVTVWAPQVMQYIPGGSFTMGNNRPADQGASTDERPLHSVQVSPFYIGRYEVYNDQMIDVLNWAYQQGKLLIDANYVRYAQGDHKPLLVLYYSSCRIKWNGSQFVLEAIHGAGHPCTHISWFGAVAFCNWLTEIQGEGLTPCYNLNNWSCNWSGTGYRLPTEAEWEKAARGGAAGHRFSWTDAETITSNRANYSAKSTISYDTGYYAGYTHPYSVSGNPSAPLTSPVGSFAPNGYGLYDMIGNVSEWCWDLSGGAYGPSPVTDPRGPAGTHTDPGGGMSCVMRGGNCREDAVYARVAERESGQAIYGGSAEGFRVVIPAGPFGGD